LPSALARLKTLRNGLARYVEALAQPAGKLGITAQELLWRCHTVRQQSSSLPSEIDELVLSDVNELTEIDIGRLVSVVDQFEHARARIVDSYGSVAKHPWNGIAHHDIDPIRAEDIVRRVRRLSEASGHGEQVLQKIAALTGVQLEMLRQLKEVAEARLIDAPDSATGEDVIAKMAEPQTLAAMEHFADELREHATLQASVAAAFENADTAAGCSTTDLHKIADTLDGAGFGDARVADASTLSEKRRQQAAAWKAVNTLMSTIASRANWTKMRTPAMERSLAAAVDSAALADSEIVAGRNASAMAPGSVSTLRNAIQRAEELKQRRTALGTRFELSAIGDSSVLRQHALAVRSAPAMPFFSPAWWRARRVFFGLVKERSRVKRAEMARSFDDLARYCDENNAYSTDEAVAKCAGAVFKGIDTDLNPLLRVAEWADRVRANLPAGDEINNQLRNLLLAGPADQIESLATMSKDPMMNTLRKVLAPDATRAFSIDAQANAAAEASKSSGRVCARDRMRRCDVPLKQERPRPRQITPRGIGTVEMANSPHLVARLVSEFETRN
jgi:hypothetical protein